MEVDLVDSTGLHRSIVPSGASTGKNDTEKGRSKRRNELTFEQDSMKHVSSGMVTNPNGEEKGSSKRSQMSMTFSALRSSRKDSMSQTRQRSMNS